MNAVMIKRILVVDDESDIREYLRTALEDAGFLVETAADGLEALASISREQPDLISLDLVMPGHSGAMLYHELQKDKRLCKIPVLIVTGHARDEMGQSDFEEMTMSGPGVYLEKPVHPDSYVSAVRRLLGMEDSNTPEVEPEGLRRKLVQAMSEADQAALRRALDALKKK
jgi:CheY-like chemotaxis protein